MSTAIGVDALTMSYADRQVLKGVDFEVKAGEVFCLLGPNGAGKTTTVEILEGFRQRTGGTVTLTRTARRSRPASPGRPRSTRCCTPWSRPIIWRNST